MKTKKPDARAPRKPRPFRFDNGGYDVAYIDRGLICINAQYMDSREMNRLIPWITRALLWQRAQDRKAK